MREGYGGGSVVVCVKYLLPRNEAYYPNDKTLFLSFLLNVPMCVSKLLVTHYIRLVCQQWFSVYRASKSSEKTFLMRIFYDCLLRPFNRIYQSCSRDKSIFRKNKTGQTGLDNVAVHAALNGHLSHPQGGFILF